MTDDASRQHSCFDRVVQTQRVLRTARQPGVYRTASLVVMLLGIVAASPAAKAATSQPATQPAPLSPSAKAVQQFHDTLKANDVAGAVKLLAASPQPVRDADRRVKRIASALAGTMTDFAVLDAKESGDIAVVIINDFLKDGRKTIDLKPWYLLKQDGQWRLLGKFTDFELKEYGFDESRIAEYRKLEEWSESREKELRKQLPDCGC